MIFNKTWSNINLPGFIDRCYFAIQKGSYMQFKHSSKKGLVTIAAHSKNVDVAPGILLSIYKQAQIDKR